MGFDTIYVEKRPNLLLHGNQYFIYYVIMSWCHNFRSNFTYSPILIEAKNGRSYAVELDALAVYAPNDYVKMIQNTVDEFYDQEIYDTELQERSSPEYKRMILQLVYRKTREFLDNYNTDDLDTSDSDSDSDTSDTSDSNEDENEE